MGKEGKVGFMFSILSQTIRVLVPQYYFNLDLSKYQRDKVIIRQQIIFLSKLSNEN